jgi:O-antigen ligase
MSAVDLLSEGGMMNPIPLAIACLLLIVAQFGYKAFLFAIAASLMIGFPAVQPLGSRTALHVYEIVIVGGSFLWLSRRGGEKREGVGSSMVPHFAAIIILAMASTALGYVWFHSYGDMLVRPMMAAFRLGTIALAFIIPASRPMPDEEFKPALKMLYWCLMGFLLIAVLERFGVVALGTYRLEAEAGSYEAPVQSGMELAAGLAGFNRAVTGTLGQLGLFVSLLAMRTKALRPYLGVPSMLGFLWVTLASFSRTNLVSLGVFALALVLLHRQNRGRNLVLVAVGIVGAVFALAVSPAMQERFSSLILADSDIATVSSGRINGWQLALVWLGAHPVFLTMGVGFDNWANYLWFETGLAAGHNAFLHATAELGLPGAILYYALFWRLGAFLFRGMKGTPEAGVIGGLGFCLLLSLVAGSMTAEVLYPSIGMVSLVAAIMFIFGLIVARLRHPSAWEEQTELVTEPSLGGQWATAQPL